MYTKACTRLDIIYVVGLFGKCQNNLGLDYWKNINEVMQYLQGSKHYMLIYIYTDYLEIVGYSNSNFGGCVDTRMFTS